MTTEREWTQCVLEVLTECGPAVECEVLTEI